MEESPTNSTGVGYHRDYEASTPRSKELFEISRRLLPAGVESNFRILKPYPFFVRRGEGARIWDIDGNEYLDMLMGQGMILLGHGHPRIRGALAEHLDMGTGFAMPTELVVRGARLVNQLVPSMEMMRFCNSGTEATMHAIRVARGFTGKDRIAKCEGGYHGIHDQVLWGIWGPDELLGDRRRPDAAPFSRGVPKRLREMMDIIPFNDLEATEDILRKNADSLAALIIEPVLANAGCLLPAEGYLQEVEKICREAGILLILDEVITGFRLGSGGAQERFDLRPDLTCLGKALGNGVPIAAFGGRRDIMEEIIPDESKWPAQVIHGGTYNAHPLGMAAAIASMETYREGAFYGQLERVSDRLFRGLDGIATDLGIPHQVSHVGPMGFVYFTDREIMTSRDALGSDWKRQLGFAAEGVKWGVLFGHPAGEKILLSAAHTDEDIDLALEVSEHCFKAVS